ncbi:MAG: hypothetical protein ACPLSJ_01200 [Thermosulfidibacteraceae bacterium]|jgi:hypothetical protein
MIFGRFLKYTLFFGMLLFVVFSIFKGYRYYSKFSGDSVKGKGENETLERGSLRDVVLEGVSEDGVRWMIVADNAKILKEVLLLENLKITYDNREKKFTVVSKYGNYSKRDCVGSAYGDVTVTMDREGRIDAKELVWYTKKGIFCLPFDFVYNSGKMEILGSDACYDTKREFIEIKNLKRVVIR